MVDIVPGGEINRIVKDIVQKGTVDYKGTLTYSSERQPLLPDVYTIANLADKEHKDPRVAFDFKDVTLLRKHPLYNFLSEYRINGDELNVSMKRLIGKTEEGKPNWDVTIASPTKRIKFQHSGEMDDQGKNFTFKFANEETKKVQ